MLIETIGLTKKYGSKVALNAINLQIATGQLVAYLGTNGAGKSTTINILTGLMKPTTGIVRYAADLKMGVVFQDSVLDKRLSVKSNILSRAKMYRHYDKDWLAELIEVIGIKQFWKQKYGTLSGGQRRRVDIARALIDQPNLLFLDDPTTGLDLQTRLVIWDLLQKLQREQGLTIFLTTHYLEEAENADQMYILENGNLLASGSTASVKKRYAPNKLKIQADDVQKIKATSGIQKRSEHQIELLGLTSKQAIEVLQNNATIIRDFEYQQGSIDDAFIKITGKELQ